MADPYYQSAFFVSLKTVSRLLNDYPQAFSKSVFLMLLQRRHIFVQPTNVLL